MLNGHNVFSLTATTSRYYRYCLLIVFVGFIFIGTTEQWLIALGVYLFKGLLGTSVVHRCLTHKSFTMHKWIEYPLAALSLAGTASSVLGWVAVHREHHRYSDTEKDPHSPVHMPWYHVQFMKWKDPDRPVNILYAADLLKVKFYRDLHNYHWLLAFGPALILFFIDPLAPLYAWFVPVYISIQAGVSVNSFNHMSFGYRNFNTNDNSHNNFITGIICLGEGWHNNHHKDPANPNFGSRWWEFDIGYQFCRLIRK